ALARRRGRMMAMTGALAASIAVALGIWSMRMRADQAPVSAATPALPTPMSTSAGAPGSVAKAPSTTQAPEPVRRAALHIVPADAKVVGDGALARVREDGTIEIAGGPGSVHRVVVSKGKAELMREVVLSESGAVPASVELSPPKPATTAVKAPSAA